MEEYPEELRSPPVSLVAVAGCGGDLLPAVSAHLHSLQPPINSLALPTLSDVSLLLAAPPPPPPAAPKAAGILRRDWLLKHRTRIPSVAAAFLSSGSVSGDPAQWLQLCSDLDSLKSELKNLSLDLNYRAAIRARNIRMVVVVVHSHSKDDITEDRMLALRKRAEIDSKYFLTFSQSDENEMNQSLQRLGVIFAELANTYYREEGRRIKTRIEKKTVGSVELHVRYCFKVAVYAEFRRDWAEAIKFYEEAYYTVREMIGTSTRLPAIQRLIEIKTIAELLHFKISTLLLHGGKMAEAVTLFRKHNASYSKVVGAAEAVFLHWEWMGRQFLVFAELLETSSASNQNVSPLVVDSAERSLTDWEFRPANYYQLAAQYLKVKRSSLETAVSMSETFNQMDSSAESVVPSTYVGQFSRLIEDGDALIMQPITDEEYIRYAIAEGKRFQDSLEIIALLRKSYESFSNLKFQRIGAFCAFQMATEYYRLGDFSHAKQLFDSIATLYRQEGWTTLLWDVLGYLRECSRKQEAAKDFVEYSLEMAALPVSSDMGGHSFGNESCPAGPASLLQKEAIHREVFGLIGGELESKESGTVLKVSGDSPIHLEIDLVSPLRVVLLASVAFHEQIIKPGSPTSITLSLLSQLPLAVEVDQLEVQFNQSACNFIVLNSNRASPGALTDDQNGHNVQTAPSLALLSNRWLRLTYDIQSDQSGKLECISVIAKIGTHFTICCRAESPASMGDVPLWKFEDRVESYPTKDLALAFTGQKAIQVAEPDAQVDLTLGASGPAFVGECFVVPVTVTSKGHDVHSGELKINLVDVRGGGLFSPREAESLSMDNSHVELLGISGSEREEDESDEGVDKIKKIQTTFGLVSVPFLKCGESWSCKLEMKWHTPKPVMLYVSLGYSPESNDSTSHKVNIHKSLHIEGKTAILISHRFMLPFRCDPLLPSRIKPVLDYDQMATLPSNETSILIVSTKNCTDVPLKLVSISIEGDDDGLESSCSVQHGGDCLDTSVVVPGEEFKKVFSITPKINASKLRLGNMCVRWMRDSVTEEQSGSAVTPVLTKQILPDMNLELSPLVVSLECPPYAITGDPFTYYIKIRNQTHLLQELKLSLSDAQSFVSSGSHNDTIYVLPKSESILGYKLVPLASGSQQLPRFTLTSVRYSVAFQPSNTATTLFVFPLKPHFKTIDLVDKKMESVAIE